MTDQSDLRDGEAGGLRGRLDVLVGGPDVSDGVGVTRDVPLVPPGLAKDLVQARVATCRDAINRVVYLPQ